MGRLSGRQLTLGIVLATAVAFASSAGRPNCQDPLPRQACESDDRIALAIAAFALLMLVVLILVAASRLFKTLAARLRR